MFRHPPPHMKKKILDPPLSNILSYISVSNENVTNLGFYTMLTIFSPPTVYFLQNIRIFIVN